MLVIHRQLARGSRHAYKIPREHVQVLWITRAQGGRV